MSEDQNQNSSEPRKDHAGAIIAIVCVGLLVLLIVMNMSC